MNNDACNGLHIVPVTTDYPYIERLLDIRDEAFPANERLASRDISQYSKENGFVTLAFEDNNELIGFMLLRYCDEDTYYGFYLAIGKEFRNKNYGGRGLKLVTEKYLKEKMMFGCVEALLPDAENYQQRVDRVRFYQQNGMYLLDEVIDAGLMGKYQFVCTDSNVTYEQLKTKMLSVFPSLTEWE